MRNRPDSLLAYRRVQAPNWSLFALKEEQDLSLAENYKDKYDLD